MGKSWNKRMEATRIYQSDTFYSVFLATMNPTKVFPGTRSKWHKLKFANAWKAPGQNEILKGL